MSEEFEKARSSWPLALTLCLIAVAVLGVEAYEFLVAPRITNAPAVFSDLKIYRGAVDYWWHGGALYNYASDNPKATGLGFTYPPFAAVVFLPMLILPPRILEWLWTIASFALIVRLALSFAPVDHVGGTEAHPAANTSARKVARVGLAVAVLGLSYPVFFNLILGQVSIFIIALAFFDAAGLPRPRIRGALVGLAAAMKLTPLIFIPYFLVTRQWRAAATASVTFVAAGVLAFVISPSTSVIYWSRNATNTARMGQIWLPWNKSVLALITRWHAGGSWQAALWVTFCLVLAFHAFMHSWRHHAEGDDLSAAILVGCAAVVVSPISWSHHQTWGVLATIVLATNPRLRQRLAGLALFCVFFVGLPLSGRTKYLEGPMPMSWRIAMEIPVLAFVAIVVLGLPSRAPANVTDGAATSAGRSGKLLSAR